MARSDERRKRTWRFRLSEHEVLEVSSPRGATEKQVRRRGRMALVLGVLITGAMLVGMAGAAVWTDQPDYAPGSIVTIAGDGMDANASITVSVARPDGVTETLSTDADGHGAFALEYTLPGLDAPVYGTYEVTASDGVNIFVTTFTDAINVNSFAPNCSTGDDSFTAGETVCAKAAGLGGTASGKIEWWAPGASSATRSTSFTNANGNATDSWVPAASPNACGTWTLKVYVPSTTFQDDDTFEVTGCVTNQPPTVEAGGPYSGNEGSNINLDGTVTDDDSPTTQWTYVAGAGVDAGATCTFAAATAIDTSVNCTDDGTYTLTLTADDGVNAPVSDTATLTVSNVPPVITSFTCPADPVAVNTSVTLGGSFTDAGTNDTHTASYAWGDGSSDSGSVTETQGSGSGTVSGSHIYTAAGIYTPSLTVTDDDGGSDTESCMYVVVYDPSAGFVTGGGWIDSPAGAYMADPSMTGKATFGFVSKYKKGATTPDGNTEFQFHAASLNFSSTSYQWLVVSGTNKATYKGFGTINGAGSYGFLLSAIDGTPDKFRIKIWDVGTSTVVYDNNLGGGDDADPATALGGGSIVIHTGKSK